MKVSALYKILIAAFLPAAFFCAAAKMMKEK